MCENNRRYKLEIENTHAKFNGIVPQCKSDQKGVIFWKDEDLPDKEY